VLRMKKKQVSFKVILVGDKAVGKTSILKKYVNDEFPEKHESTWGVNLIRKEFPDGDKGKNVTFWDITSNDLFQDQRIYYYEGAEAVILVYDVTKPETFSNLERWYEEIAANLKLEKEPIFILGNKNDLDQNIPQKAIQEFTFRIEAKHFFISAKTGENVDKVFKKIINTFE